MCARREWCLSRHQTATGGERIGTAQKIRTDHIHRGEGLEILTFDFVYETAFRCEHFMHF